MNDEIRERLEAFAREEPGRPLFGGKLNLRPEPRLEQDPGATGLDAVAFIDKWAETIGVDAQGSRTSAISAPKVRNCCRHSSGCS